MSLVVWGKHLWAPEHPGWVVFPFTLQRSLHWLQREPRHQKLRCSSALNVHWKHLHMKLHSRYTWTHVFGHVSSIWKPEGWKMLLGLWRGEGEGREGTEDAAFPASGSLNQSCSRVKYLFLSQEFIFMLHYIYPGTFLHTGSSSGLAEATSKTNGSVLGKKHNKTPTALGSLVCTLAK